MCTAMFPPKPIVPIVCGSSALQLVIVICSSINFQRDAKTNSTEDFSNLAFYPHFKTIVVDDCVVGEKIVNPVRQPFVL